MLTGKIKIIFTIIALMICNTVVVEQLRSQPNRQVNYQHLSEQIDCMAKNIYYEAGHESREGMAAVARVVVNRVRYGFERTICRVVYQKTRIQTADQSRLQCEFSWTCAPTARINQRSARYQQSLQIAYEVVVNDAYQDIVPRSTLFFHNTQVDPEWKYKPVKQIGNHIFYRK